MRNTERTRALSALAALATLFCVSSAQAVLLSPGTAVFGSSGSGDPYAALTPDATVGGMFATNGSPSATGTITQDAFLNTTVNGVTGVGFRWTVTHASTSASDEVSQINMDMFANWTLDADWITSSDDAPDFFNRSSGGDVVRFNWIFGQFVQGETQVFYVQTNAPGFKFGQVTGVQNGGVGSVDTLMPTPEPGSLILLGSSLAGLGYLGRRRRKNRPGV